MKRELLRIENGKKGLLLKRICLHVFAGEIIGLIFDNIQEKQMFLKIMSGQERFDYAKISYEEENIREEDAAGIFKEKAAVISRHRNLIDTVTIGENIFLIRGGVREHWVHQHRYKKEAEKLFQEFGITMDPGKRMRDTTAFEQIEIEIIKAYILGKKIIFLTALANCLNDREVIKLRELLYLLRDKGTAVVMTEPLEDLDLDDLDMVAVIKRGKTCAVKASKACDYTMIHTILYRDEIQKNMDIWRAAAKNRPEENSVRIDHLSSEHMQDLSFEVKRGEIVKLFCADEDSYEEMTQILRGKKKILGGYIYVNGELRELNDEVHGLGGGIGLVEGNPVSKSLFADMTAMDNLCLPLSNKADGIWIFPKYKKSIRLRLQDILKEHVYDTLVRDLKPEERQKVIYSKWLLYAPELLVCIQPFAEGDIKAREAAREMIYLLEERRIPVLIITSNSAELNYCRGREIYIKNGKML